MRITLVLAVLLAIALSVAVAPPLATAKEPLPMPGDALSDAQVDAFAKLALNGIGREYPNKLGQVLTGPADLKGPKALHPVFYGCFDWHSAVHSHWALVRLAKSYPTHPIAVVIRKELDKRFTKEALQKEADYFRPKANRSFERTYGWAWLLQLARELRTWDDADAKRWAGHLRPLESVLVKLTKAFLPKMQWPLRSGLHIDTAFALGMFHDYARDVADTELAALVAARAKHFYAKDKAYPTRYEPSGFDFFSGGLNEADLMRRILPAPNFLVWLEGFWPGLQSGELGNWSGPVTVTDLEDGHLVHLVGLNLTRAWTMRGIASVMPATDPRRAKLESVAAVHAKAGLSQVFSGDYAGEHWLGSFAIYLLTDAGIK